MDKKQTKSDSFSVSSYFPKEFAEIHYANKPIGVRVHKKDCRITHVMAESSLVGKAFVGDIIAELDGKKINSSQDIVQILKEGTNKVWVKVNHSSWSWCFHHRTTVEKIQIDKETEKITPKPVNMYYVMMRFKITPETPVPNLGLYVKYDNRDRLQVASVRPNSLASVHLRPGDLIRECNDQQVSSKSLLNYMIINSIKNSESFTLLIEAPIADANRDHIEVAEDVVKIADKQIELFKKSNKMAPPQTLLNKKGSASEKNLNAKLSSTAPTEIPIVSDIDHTRLKPCKNAT